MGRLRHLASGLEHPLGPRHLLGRAPTCSLRIDDPGVSGYHAELIWDGEAWSVQDLGSRNGTTLADKALAKGEERHIARGDELVLAGNVRFELIDDAPPTLIATASDGEVRVAEDELLCLPSEEWPELTLFREIDGRWWVETDTETYELREDESLIAGERSWRVSSPKSLPRTREAQGPGLLAELVLRFEVSRDGEHVALALVREGAQVELDARVHQLLLLALARSRLADATNPDLPRSEQGWVYREDLPRMLDGVELDRVHLWIHRARKQLAKAGVRDAAGIIERRASGTQLRIGAPRLEVHDA